MSDVILDREGINFVKGLLSETEQQLVDSFVRSEKLVEAVRKVLLTSVYNNGTLTPDQRANPSRNFMLSITNRRELTNEEVGAQARAVAEAIALIEIGFSYLQSLKTEDIKVEEKVNKAR